MINSIKSSNQTTRQLELQKSTKVGENSLNCFSVLDFNNYIVYKLESEIVVEVQGRKERYFVSYFTNNLQYSYIEYNMDNCNFIIQKLTLKGTHLIVVTGHTFSIGLE